MTADAAEPTSRSRRQAESQRCSRTATAASKDGELVWVEPDLDFIRALRRQGGDALKRCFQCGTCSATCGLAPDSGPFPRKEMAWANWGMKDRLLASSDVWLCHQCNDCSTRCPRGARPGDVLGAIRQECIQHHAVPRFLGRWVNQPHCVPLMLGIPAALLTLCLLARDPIENALGISRDAGDKIVFAYSNLFPHWMLNSFFGLFSVLALVVVIVGVLRFWRAMGAAWRREQNDPPARGLGSSIVVTLKSIIVHDRLTLCTQARSRYWSHMCVFFGFVALSLVTLWVITAKYNPLIGDDFAYPFGFWNPWKILANLGGLALVAGCLLMIRDRWRDRADAGLGSYFDWALISKLLLVVLTGFATEVLHFLRLEPHRHVAYFVHLVFAFAVLMYLPYSKLAHLAYRAAALVFIEYSGRNRAGPLPPAARRAGSAHEGQDDVGDTATR